MNTTICQRLCWIAAVAALAGGCAITPAEYDARLDAWIGATEEDLVAGFGPPDRIEEGALGDKVVFWEASQEMEQKSEPAGVGPVSISFSTTTTFTCHLSFLLLDGRAESHEWKSTRTALFKNDPVDTKGVPPCDEAFPALREESDPDATNNEQQGDRKEHE